MTQINSQLLSNANILGRLELCHVLLVNHANFPWLMLVPDKPNLIELIDLSIDDQHLLIDEIDHASRIVKSVFNADKLNIATLGNQVSQLHIHVIARHKNDAAWPNPIWQYPTASLASEDQLARITQLSEAFGFITRKAS